MQLRDLLERLDEADYWKFNTQPGQWGINQLFICNGHGVNVYSERLNYDDRELMDEVDFFNVGSFKKNNATVEEFKDGIKDYLS